MLKLAAAAAAGELSEGNDGAVVFRGCSFHAQPIMKAD